MSKKFSSFDKQQLITENFRKFINENKTTKDVGGDAVDFAAIANSIEDLSYLTDEGKKGFAAGLKYISNNGYDPEKGDYKKIVNDLNGRQDLKDREAWKNGFKDAAYKWDDFMEEREESENPVPVKPEPKHFDDFKKWLGGGEEREQRRLEDEEALDYDDYLNDEYDD